MIRNSIYIYCLVQMMYFIGWNLPTMNSKRKSHFIKWFALVSSSSNQLVEFTKKIFKKHEKKPKFAKIKEFSSHFIFLFIRTWHIIAVKRGEDSITMIDDFIEYSLIISKGFMNALPYQTTYVQHFRYYKQELSNY